VLLRLHTGKWGLRDYGCAGQIGLEPTPEAYVEKLVAVFREVRRVLRDDGVLWLNLGDSYTGGANSGGANQNDGGLLYRGSGLPNKRGNGLKPKDLIGIPWRVAFALQSDAWWLRQDIIWNKPNPMPESVRDRCTKAHEYVFLLTKSARYYYDAEAVKEALITEPHAPGNLKLDASRNDHDQMQKVWGANGMRNRRSVWTITTKPFKEAHFATFPPEIPEICIKAGSKPGDIILDPFSGSGTTGNVAERLGRKYIGIELNPAYSEMGEKRIDAARLPLAEQWG
jgi:DNA modification methylase